MARQRRSDDWGFPRWRPYDGIGRNARPVRTCDREGCDRPATCPAPKAPDRPERWWFCREHAAEYNRAWDYFAARRTDGPDPAAEEARTARGYRQAAHWRWAAGDRGPAERAALKVLDLPEDADEDAVKAAFRRHAKAHHPDLNPGDAGAAERFRTVQAAYDLLMAAEARRRATAAAEDR
ncbi:MAG: J domain-containing protein [Sphingomonadaceae bacterium]|uniref:J domain-containing protein n=1 Tax=Thermaurantiacus sp. TaxID=2820283 RepID=UPI00298EFD9A|nr:J domain-containing protein [Thermaurantiacus sp.]MCS6986625.1 J domain-containing protein [Sphingomonadaceae bacterium]MDW8414114.1 J domain-containing protein [Thermaurantiacus sp.]